MDRIIAYWREHLLAQTYALALVLGFFLLSRLLPFLLARISRRLGQKSRLDVEKIVRSFSKPLALLLLATGFYLAAISLLGSAAAQFATKLFRSLVILVVARGLDNLVASSSGLLAELGNSYELDKLFLALLSKSLRGLIYTIGAVILIQEWGYDITGFIAGLGLGGLAFALAAQDTAANLIGGVVILTEKPFTIGDWIETEKLEGIVEDISFRSTRVRTFAQGLVTAPNSSLAKEPITNWSRMGRRQILLRLGVDLATPPAKLERCLGRIRQSLQDNSKLYPQIRLANLEKADNYGLVLYINCYAQATALAEWLSVREGVLLEVLAILEAEAVVLARTYLVAAERG